MDIKELVVNKLKEKFPKINFETSEFRGELTAAFDKKILLMFVNF